MQVLKFGGTSVGSPSRMREVGDIIDDGSKKIIVLSAVSGTTNKLVQINTLLSNRSYDEAGWRLELLAGEYETFITELFSNTTYQEQARSIVGQSWDIISTYLDELYQEAHGKHILAQGELISTQLFQLYLESQDIKSALLPALDFMRLNEEGEPNIAFLSKRLPELLANSSEEKYYITQGYICRNSKSQVDNLQRGGSDYTATLIGAALECEEVQIWTDIDGLHNNDPRIVDTTYPIRKVSYREAAELAYFGAKILHPTCIIPAEKANVPVRLKNTFDPTASGTLISEESSGRYITALAAKDGITAIRIRSGRMMNAYGFLRKVFEVFEQYRTPIDMITTSEVSVSLTIDNNRFLNEIAYDIRQFGEVAIDEDQTIICIVGDLIQQQNIHTKEIFAALADVPIRMISYGGSKNNISILVPKNYKKMALRLLHEFLFVEEEALV